MRYINLRFICLLSHSIHAEIMASFCPLGKFLLRN